MLDPRARPVVWLIPETMARRQHWLEALRRILRLYRVNAAAILIVGAALPSQRIRGYYGR